MKKIACSVLMLLASMPILTAADRETEIFLLDTKEDIVMGITAFTGVNLEPENEYLTANIPVLIRERLSEFPDRSMSDEEVSAHRRGIIRRAIQAREESKSKLYEEWDRLFFEGSRDETREREFSQKIQEYDAEILKLKDYDDGEIEVSERKPLILKGMDGEQLLMMEEIGISPLRYSTENELDLLLYGKIEQIEDYFFVEIHLWNQILGEETLLIEDAAARDDIDDLLERVLPASYDAVVGTEWAFLSIIAEPPEADIFVDREFAGTGRAQRFFILPGEHTVSAEAPGHEENELSVSLEPGETKEVSISLNPAAEEQITIMSTPMRGNVYLDSTWLGKTPLTIPRPRENFQRLMVSMKDFSAEYLIINSESPEEIGVTLSPFQFDTGDYLAKKRDQFYLSAGFFVLSFPVPFFLYSLTEDLASGYSVASQIGNFDEMTKKLNASLGVYHGYIGSIILTAGLLINTVFRLVDYIRAGELY